MGKPLCIYHNFCADGFGAAWVIRKAFDRAVDFFGASYGQEPPDVAGRDVIMVDFSYKRPVLEGMGQQAKTLLILDHHKTAAEDLAGLWTPPGSGAWRTLIDAPERVPSAALFDMNRSGAGLAWDYFFPNEKRPDLINHIEDRDLWRFAINGTREIQAAVFSYPYDFAVWDDLLFGVDAEGLRREGEAIERKHHKDVAELVGATQRRMVIGGYDVPVANLPYTLTSDAGHLMAKGQPFAACYLDTLKGRTFSLRSTDEGVDVSAIAKAYGGGGHRNAAGFIVPIGWEGEQTP